ncbi:unnamed protein product [Fraxinus pennsylvanica]|uniref:NADH pyrophosphatase-like N-terminal domain-containing protein n=1 Tax=Fraxinus pennsylvanica TaxID=56036 RepID=A0AAD2A7D5_9LAMI|nr:unnamed protein product [Fraxinus pennsylvanica]
MDPASKNLYQSIPSVGDPADVRIEEKKQTATPVSSKHNKTTQKFSNKPNERREISSHYVRVSIGFFRFRNIPFVQRYGLSDFGGQVSFIVAGHQDFGLGFMGNPIRSRTPKQTDPLSPHSAFQILKTLLLSHSQESISPDFKVLPFRKGKPLAGTTADSPADGTNWHLGWLSLRECKEFLENSEVSLSEDSVVYLGCKYEGDVVYCAIDVSDASGLVSELVARQFCFVELRTLMVATDWADAKAMGQRPRALIEWHNIARYCGSCGGKTIPMEAGRRKQCSNESCKKRIYPRVDPRL